MTVDVEKFIRDAAARNWSRTQTLEALGICRETFYAMLKAMPPLEWAAPGASLGAKLAHEARRGHCSDALMVHLKGVHARRREKHSHDYNGHRGTIEQLARYSAHGVSASTIRRRMSAGMSLEQAMSLPQTPINRRRNGFNQ
ncbi:hypothetical protein [Pseudomonas atacamensis]|uniref:hypothetical protein n=1 Tax=Pseudomonas atacamensis TaxID=2565368 RepID=UPI0019CF7E4C|nr:hypothetical protein [Pseudomonas atacamensis]QSL90474.1 hypothetical protein JWU58_26920 [Pseudomonas atacamensis]